MKYLNLTIAVLLILSNFVKAQDGKAIFERNCTACHTIGQGKKVGPDLKGVNERHTIDWLVKFVKSSKAMIDAGDKDAIAVYEENGKKPMPSHTLSVGEIQAIFTYVASGGGGAVADAVKTDSLKPLFVPSAEKGRLLFTGETPFTNGGASCISCHSIRAENVFYGGTVAKDLSVSYVDGIVETMLATMPAMISTFQSHELTIEEKANLELFLKTVKQNQLYNHPKESSNILFIGGIAVLLLLLLIMNIFWPHTKKYGVKDEIFRRQIRIN